MMTVTATLQSVDEGNFNHDDEEDLKALRDEVSRRRVAYEEETGMACTRSAINSSPEWEVSVVS